MDIKDNMHFITPEIFNIIGLTALMNENHCLWSGNPGNYEDLQLVKNSTMETIFIHLKLKQIFDLTKYKDKSFLKDLMDLYGQMMWHLIKKIDFQLSNTQWMSFFWQMFWTKYANIKMDMNRQDKQGYTPLHFVVQNEYDTAEVLEQILTQFDDIDPFLCDNKGNTFLHYYFEKYNKYRKTEFNRRLLRGEINNLPKSAIKKLINSQNNAKDTPLFLYILNSSGNEMSNHWPSDYHYFMSDYCTLHRLLKAGLDLKLSNKKAETLMHIFVQRMYLKDTDESLFFIEWAVKNGADINAKNKQGDSVLFRNTPRMIFRFLVHLGGDVNFKNKSRQTPLLSLLCNSEEKDSVKTLENIKMLLDSGADVNATDIYGNNALHYAAWSGSGLDIITELKRYTIQTCLDKLGQLPCEVAVWCGEHQLLDVLCSCESHEHTEHFQKYTLTETELKISQSDKIYALAHMFNQFKGDSMCDILKVPGVGKVVFENEAKEIKNVVTEIVENIRKNIHERNKMLSFKMLESGSVSEDTKVGLPDEFDFVFVLDQINELFCVEENIKDSGFAHLKPKFFNTEFVLYFSDLKSNLDTKRIRDTLDGMLKYIFHEDEIFCYPNISSVEYDTSLNPSNDPVIHFTFQWQSCFYKNLTVDIDIAPACQIPGWWPSNTNISAITGDNQAIKDEGALLLLQTDEQESYDVYIGDKSTLRISALLAEKKLMKSLPQIAKDAYIICKSLCRNRVCPTVSSFVVVKKFIKSYMLKTCMFQVFDNNSGLQSNNNFVSTDSLYDVVLKIMRQFLKCSEEDKLPSYMFPPQDIFHFTVGKDDPKARLNQEYRRDLRTQFAKIIISIIEKGPPLNDNEML